MMGGFENLGPGVSQNPQAVSPGGGNFSADDRSYDSLVFQQNCPPMDWEMNLLQSVVGNSGLRNLASKLYSSTFISSEVLNVDKPGDTGSAFTFLAPIAGNENKFELAASDILVNGNLVRFEYSGTNVAGTNVIELNPPPVAGVRQDLVMIEVWRALLSPLPSSDNKSPAGQIYRNGNAKAPDPPTNVNLADDILDPTYLAETSRRVQVQYRYRVIDGVDILTYPDGIDDPTVTAHTVPYYLAGPVDGNNLGIPFFPYPNDPGLYVTGSNDAISAGSFGSVDGLVYAIPLCVVVRRNSAAFDKALNLNGAPAIGSPSTRPDGLFCDQIIGSDVIDLRKITAFNPAEFRDNAINSILQNKLTTQLEISGSGPGGNTFLNKDSIGIGAHIGDADGARMTFSDRPIVQAIPLIITAPGGTNSFTLSLSGAELPWSGGSYNLLANSPADTDLLAITKVLAPDAVNVIENALDPAALNPVVSISYSIFGTVVDTATIVFQANVPAGTIYLEALINYPRNSGLDRNVVGDYEYWVPSAIIPGTTNADPAYFTATFDITRLSINAPYFSTDFIHREASFTLPSTIVASPLPCFSTTNLMIPDMVDPTSINIAGYAITAVEENAGCTFITFNPPVVLPTTLNVDYTAYRAPLPLPLLETIDIFTDTRAIQSIPVPAGNFVIDFVKRTDFDRVWLVNSASGNLGNGTYDASSQICIPKTPIVNYSDSLLSINQSYTPLSTITNGISKNSVLTNDFFGTSSLSVYNAALSVTQDADGRNFWPLHNIRISGSDYVDITASIPRKLGSDFIVELTNDFAGYGRKGTMFLALVTDYVSNAKENNILNSQGISIFRLRGNPIYYRRSST